MEPLKARRSSSTLAFVAFQRRKEAILLAASIFLGAGCQSDDILKATAKYATASAVISEVYPAITKDYLDNCKRIASYDAFGGSRENPDAAMRFAKERERCFEGGVLSSASNAAAMNTINELIVDYLKSLAGLADAKDYTKDIAKLAESIGGLPGMGDRQQAKDTVEAGKTIASVLTNQISKTYRASKIREIVIRSDRALAVLTYSLSWATYLGYLGEVSQVPASPSSRLDGDRPSLARENSLLNNYYGSPIDASQRHLPRQPVQGFVETSLYDKWIEEQAKLDSRRAVAHKYLKLLRDITCDHTALRLMIEKNSTTSVEDANQNCKEPSDGGLNVNRQSGDGPARLEDRLVVRLNSYRVRIEELSLDYQKAFMIQ